MKSIRTYSQYLREGEIPLVDFFIESSYIDGKGQTRPCCLITKKEAFEADGRPMKEIPYETYCIDRKSG